MLDIVATIDKLNYSEVDPIRCGHLLSVLKTIAENKIPGDLVETGVFKGGTACIMSYANIYFNMNKNIWLCDSFIGCPDPELTKYGRHIDETHNKGDFACSLEQVKENMNSLGLLNSNVHFVEGWFQDTMPTLNIDSIALLRFDGDLYSSTLEVLEALYPKVVSGGYVIIDDYCLAACKAATDEYIKANQLVVNIKRPFIKNNVGVVTGDSCGSWWIK